jgi:WD40 repeat protein
LLEATNGDLFGAVPLAPDAPSPSAFDVSLDGKLAAVVSEGATNNPSIELWDLSSRKRRVLLAPRMREIRNLTFSRDARYLACTGDNGLIAYDTSDFKTVAIYRGYLVAPGIWTGDGTTLAMPLSQENVVRLLEVTSANELTRLTTHGEVKDVRSSADGSVVVVVDSTGPVLAVHLVDTHERVRLTGHVGGVPGVQFSPDGKRVASTGKDETIRLWDAATGKPLQVWTGQHPEGQSVSFSPDGRWLASGNYRDNKILVWSIADGKPVLVLGEEFSGEGQTWSCAFSPDGGILVSAGTGLRAWQIAEKNVGDPGPPLKARLLFSDSAHARNLQIHPNGKSIAFEGTVRRDGKEVSGSFTRDLDPRSQLELADSHKFAVETLGLADNGRTLLNMEMDHTFHFWDSRSRKIVRSLPALTKGESSTSYIGNFSVSPDGTKVAVANYNGLGVNIYDLASGRRVYSLPDEPGSIWWLAWAPDSRRVAVSRGDGDISLWNLTEVESILKQAGLAP